MKFLESVYRLALWLYPRSFRAQFADELVELHRSRLRDTQRSRGVVWLEAFASALRHGPAERWSALRGHDLPEPRPPETPPRGNRSFQLVPLVFSILQDVRIAWRALLRRPLVGAVMIVTLAVGLGANAFLFGVVDAVLLRPLPYEEPDRLVLIDNRYDENITSSSPPDFVDRRDLAESLGEVAAFHRTEMAMLPIVESGAQARQVQAAFVTGQFFELLGVSPRLGHIDFPSAEGQPSSQIVISYGTWRTVYGGDSAVVGHDVLLDGVSHTISAVLPPGVDLPRHTDIWLPLTFTPEQLADSYRPNEFLTTLGRLADDFTVEHAAAEMDALAQRTLELQPSRADFLRQHGFGAHVEALGDSLVGDVRPALFLFSFAVGAILLLACANVAHLLLAQATARSHEMSVRRALGAGKLRLVRQVLTESLLLSFLGAGLGIGLAAFGLRFLEVLVPRDVPRIEQATLDPSLIAFALALSMVSAVVFGIPAAVRNTGAQGLRAGRTTAGTKNARTVRRALVVVEVALALLLVASASLLLRSFQALTTLDVGFETGGRTAFRINLPSESSAEQILSFHAALQERFEAIPGIHGAATADHLPLSGRRWTATFRPEGSPTDVVPSADIKIVGTRFFEVLGVPLLAGRHFDTNDVRDGTRVVIVDEWTARRHFVGTDGQLAEALGRRINVGDLEDPRFREIVGIVGHVRTRAFDEEGLPQLYFSATQVPLQTFDVVLSSAGDPSRLAPQLRSMLQELNPNLPLHAVVGLDELVGRSVALERFQTRVLGALASLALFLASVGLYGVLAFAVSRRGREFGLRIALGASARQIASSVIREALVLTLLGLSLGAGLALVAVRWLHQLTWKVTTADPASWLVAAMVLLAVAVLAASAPALRATRISPSRALQAD
ncbi:MAG: ADOP family duplicated permease [Thermoanaerobaculia bacterium]|nr:ADOP family duplicated permease [Thermoanaerobaculia bacterium]